MKKDRSRKNKSLPQRAFVANRKRTSYKSNMTERSYIQSLRDKIGHDRLIVPSVAAVIRDEQSRLLLQRKSGREGWSLPAGAIELGETPEQALKREVLEETGLEVLNATLAGAFGGRAFRHTYPNGDQVEYTVLLYHCAVQKLASGPTDPETVELTYFAPAEAPTLAMPYPKEVLFD